MPTKSQTVAYNRERGVQPLQETQKIFESNGKVVGGMDTFNDPTVIDPSQWVSLLNVTNRFSKLSRRAGGALITPVKPNSNKILKFYTTTLWNTDAVQLRFTRNSIHSRSSSAWTPFTGQALTGSDTDRIKIVNFINRIFFSNNGVDPIRELDPVGNVVNVLGNAPRFKYICSVSNRIVGAYLKDTPDNPTLIGWSGDLNLGEWDPLVDFSAGSNPLYESQSEYSEFITGIFGFETTVLVMRQRSIVLGTLQPSATDPFYFYTSVPGIGSDSPDTIQRIPEGVIFYDFRTRMVYQYTLAAGASAAYGASNGVSLIGLPIAETLTNQITDPSLLTSSFDPINLEYQLCISVASSNTTRIWTYNLKTKAWSFDEKNNVSSIDNVEFSQSTGAIGDLVGTIGNLLGTIASLSPSVNTSTRFYSFINGDIEQYDALNDVDEDGIYTTTIESKVFELPLDDASFQRVRIEIIVRKATTITLSYSKDNGVSWSLYKSVSLTPQNNVNENNRQLVIASKHIRSRQLKFKIESVSGLWDIVGYEVHYLADSPSRK